MANRVSGDGSVVVGISGGHSGQAFRWTAADGMVGLGRPPGDFYSYARGVNDDGSVVVGGSDYAADEGSEYVLSSMCCSCRRSNSHSASSSSRNRPSR